jgi:ribonuclease HII
MAQANNSLWSNDRLLLLAKEPQTQELGLVGVDEAGRGALAGPVYAAAFWLPWRCFQAHSAQVALSAIRDSKMMRPAAREAAVESIAAFAKTQDCAFAVASADVAEIESVNILGATKLAMSRAIEQLGVDAGLQFNSNETSDMPLWQEQWGVQKSSHGVTLLIDGKPLRGFRWQHEALVGGDSRSLVIAAASVLAKVARDQHMQELATEFPHYGFETHAGYGTLAHRKAICEHGPCAQHRSLFLRKIVTTQESEFRSRKV